MYPMVMFTVAITVMVFMLIKVVPIFAKCTKEWSRIAYTNSCNNGWK